MLGEDKWKLSGVNYRSFSAWGCVSVLIVSSNILYPLWAFRIDANVRSEQALCWLEFSFSPPHTHTVSVLLSFVFVPIPACPPSSSRW